MLCLCVCTASLTQCLFHLSLQGIFPASHVHIKECTVLNPGSVVLANPLTQPSLLALCSSCHVQFFLTSLFAAPLSTDPKRWSCLRRIQWHRKSVMSWESGASIGRSFMWSVSQSLVHVYTCTIYMYMHMLFGHSFTEWSLWLYSTTYTVHYLTNHFLLKLSLPNHYSQCLYCTSRLDACVPRDMHAHVHVCVYRHVHVCVYIDMYMYKAKGCTQCYCTCTVHVYRRERGSSFRSWLSSWKRCLTGVDR